MLHTTPSFKTRAWLTSLPLALLLSACGGGGQSEDTSPLARYRTQTVQWTDCPERLVAPGATSPVALATRCARIVAPINYQDPERGDLEIAISRVPSMNSQQRQGILMFNPGGPGADGFGLPADMHNLLSGSNPADELGRRQLMLLDRYDLIGFSPRGTGYSANLECVSDEPLFDVSYAAVHRYAPGNIDNMLANAQTIVRACHNHPLYSEIHTEATVQDMDLIRHLLQEEQINYLGYSYGTWLGAWYASRFPERVGRMVLDSNMDFTSDGLQADLAQGPARERWIDEVVAPYAVRHANHFGLGSDPIAIRTLIENLMPGVQIALIGTLASNSYASSALDESVYSILAAREIDQIFTAYPQASDEVLTGILKSHIYAPHNPAIETEVQQAAFALLSNWWSEDDAESDPPAQARQGQQGQYAVALDASDSTYWAVMCNDTRYPDHADYWIETGNQMAAQYPLFGTNITEHLCHYWGGPHTHKPDLEALQSAHLLLVQSEYDNATPYAGARAFFDQLPASQWVAVPGEFAHALFPYGDRCVDAAVVNYLLGIEIDERETECPALPFTQDARTQVSRAQLQSTYLNAATAQQQIDALKQTIRNAAKR